MFDVVNVTGFMPFGSLEINPTQKVVEELRKNPHHSIRRIQRLDVSIRECDFYVHYLSISCNPREGKILNLHFGFGSRKVYYLESTGYNMKDFRIPDNDGVECEREKIEDGMQLDQPVKTKVNLNWLADELKKKGQEVTISNDPGRYICNYIYFNSMNQVKGDFVASLFVHFPDYKDKTHEQNVKFVRDLLDILTS